MNNLGNTYYSGIGVQADREKALFYYMMAGDQGDVGAMANLGSLYLEKENYRFAAIWYGKAAKMGLANAQYNIGVLFEEVIKNFIYY